MRQRALKQLLTVGVLFSLMLAARASAHHSFAAEYDGNQPVTVSGTVAKVEWTRSVNSRLGIFVPR
jgi:hypothetical protein